jgi:hypothetical protein
LAGALRCLQRPRVLTPTRARRCSLEGVVRGSDVMRKSLRHLLDRLRAATNGRLRGKRTSIRAGLEEPQQMQVPLMPAPVRSQS